MTKHASNGIAIRDILPWHNSKAGEYLVRYRGIPHTGAEWALTTVSRQDQIERDAALHANRHTPRVAIGSVVRFTTGTGVAPWQRIRAAVPSLATPAGETAERTRMQLIIDIELGIPYTMTITQTPDPTGDAASRVLDNIYPNRNNLIGVLARTWAAVLAETPATSVTVSVCGDRATCTSDMADAIARIEYLLSEEEGIRAAA